MSTDTISHLNFTVHGLSKRTFEKLVKFLLTCFEMFNILAETSAICYLDTEFDAKEPENED